MVIALAMGAPIAMLAVFGNDEWFLNQFNLLMFFRRFAGGLQGPAAFRACLEREVNDCIELAFVERCAQMPLVPLLPPNVPFPLAFPCFGRFYNIR